MDGVRSLNNRAYEQLDVAFSMTAMSVDSWSKLAADLLKSFR